METRKITEADVLAMALDRIVRQIRDVDREAVAMYNRDASSKGWALHRWISSAHQAIVNGYELLIDEPIKPAEDPMP